MGRTNMRFQVITGVKGSIVVVWVVTPCNLVSFQRFGGTYHFRLHDEVSLNRR
jgi:hypothetical protein